MKFVEPPKEDEKRLQYMGEGDAPIEEPAGPEDENTSE